VTTRAISGERAGPLIVRTVRLGPDAAANLLDLLPDERPVSWLRRGEGLVGWGAAAEIRTKGATRFADADKWWAEVADAAVVRDEVNEPGTGLVSFGSFAFADEPGDSVLVAPEVVVGRRGDTTWLTTISRHGSAEPGSMTMGARADEVTPPVDVRFGDGALNGEQWMSVIDDAVRRISSGALEKVVLARDLVATASAPIDVRWPLRRLAEDYPMCWTFHVDGIFGATP
jgi:menaquinone-specific isochorismate synthase